MHMTLKMLSVWPALLRRTDTQENHMTEPVPGSIRWMAALWQVDVATYGDSVLLSGSANTVCDMPIMSAPGRRLRSGNHAMVAAALEACAGKSNEEACASDVLVTGNANLAKLW
jgi:hypothetical protein